MPNNRNISIISLLILEILLSLHCQTTKQENMKSSELHRLFIKAGYKFDHAVGSHYFYTDSNGILTEPVPYHGTKEMGKGLANKLINKYKLK